MTKRHCFHKQTVEIKELTLIQYEGKAIYKGEEFSFEYSDKNSLTYSYEGQFDDEEEEQEFLEAILDDMKGFLIRGEIQL